MLSDVNQTIVRVRILQELFKAVCRIAVEKGGFRMAWIGILDPQTKQLKPAAHAGETNDYLDKLNITLDDNANGSGQIASALRSAKHFVVNDIKNNTELVARHADAIRMGYRASAALPLKVAGEVRGSLILYAAEPGFFEDNVVKLLDEMAADIAFALEFSEQEDQRRRAELLLRESEHRYQTLAKISPVGIFHTDPNGCPPRADGWEA
jgi:GAF domain-containing protein